MKKTAIQWTNASQNFWTGCRKISEGCKFCYMHRIYEKGTRNASTVVRANDKAFYAPYFDKVGKLIFTCSMSDFFIEEADPWRGRAWATIKNTPWHTWQILTKRPERIAECLPADWGTGYPNVWLGVTVENQKNLHRMHTLAQVPAALRFISAEPLLGNIDFLQTDGNGTHSIDFFSWIILGGESGNDYGKYQYRPCDPKWMENIVNQLSSRGIKIFVKQMGTYLAKQGLGAVVGANGWVFPRHGDDFNFFPHALQIREMPAWGQQMVLAI